MGNLCSSGSERADNKEEKRVPGKLKDGEDEALLRKFGDGVGLVAGQGSGDGSGGVGSAVTSKVLENGQCVMAGGRGVCPEIFVTSSDVEPVEDDDDDDFLKSVIAVVEDTTGRVITSAQDVVAEIEARNLPQSDDAVVSFPGPPPHGEGSARDSVSADHAAVGKSSRESVGAESTNWADSVLMSATTAAQNAFHGSSDFSSDFTRKEDSPCMSVLGENSNNIVALSATGGDTVDEATVVGTVETGPLSGENSQPGTDSVSEISTRTEHTLENTLTNCRGLNNDAAGASGSQLSGGGGGSSVDGFVAEDEGCEQCVVGEASDHQDSLDLAPAGRINPVSPGDENPAHEDGLGTSVDAQVDFINTSLQEYDHNNRDEESVQSKEFECEDVPSTLGALVGQLASDLSGQLEKTALPPEDDIFAGWSIVSDTDILKGVSSDDSLNLEAAAREIVEVIVTRASLTVSEIEREKGPHDSSLSLVDKDESVFADQQPHPLLGSLTDRFASPPELSPSPSLDTDQCQPAGGDSSTSSISQGDLIDIEELLIPPVSPLNVLGESRDSHIFDSNDEDTEDASIKQTAWSITDRAVQEAIKIVAENGCHLKEDFNQPHNNDLDLYPSGDASGHDECNSELSDTSLNNNTESPTHMNGANGFPEHSTQIGLTSNHEQSAPAEITPAEGTLAQPTSHTNKPPENDLMDIPDNPADASPLIPSDAEFISSSSPPTSNGEYGDSKSNTEICPLYISKVPSFLPPLDNDSLPGKPVIIINSPDSAANTGSNEDISVHTEPLI